MRNFLGKSVDDVLAMFREREHCYGEALMHMGPVAFRYYFPAACRFIQDALPDAHPPWIFEFGGQIEQRLEFEPQELVPIAAELLELCHEILIRFSRFDEFDHIVRSMPELLKSQGLDSEILSDVCHETPTNLRDYITQVAARLEDLINST